MSKTIFTTIFSFPLAILVIQDKNGLIISLIAKTSGEK